MLIRDRTIVVQKVGDRPQHERTVAGLRPFWTNRKFILRAVVCSFLASALIALLIPVRYRSVTRLMPPDELLTPGAGMLSAIAGRASGTAGLGDLAGSFLGMKSSGALFVGILQSQTVQDRLIERFALNSVYGSSKIEDTRAALAEHTDVSQDRKSGIIAISVTDHDPKRATLMAQTYVEELDRLVAQVSTSSARRERIFLEERLKTVKTDLDNSARNFSDFASKNSAIDIPAQGRAMVEAAAKLQGELIAVQSELQGLRQIYTDENVRVRSTKARADELQKKLNEIGGAGTGQDATGQPSLYPSMRRLPILGVTYADLFQQTKIEEAVYELLTEQYELAKVQEAKEIPSVKVLDVAKVPTKKIFPPRSLITLSGAFLGFVFATIWVVAKSGWEAIEANDLRKEFAMEVFTELRTSLPTFSRTSANGSSNGGPNGSSNGHGSAALWGKSEGPQEHKNDDHEG